MTTKTKRKAGQAPGSLVYHAQHSLKETRIITIRYNKDFLQETASEQKPENFHFEVRDSEVLWIDLQGIDVDTLQKLGSRFNLHSLLMEDVLDFEHRPKLDDYGDNLYIVLRNITFDHQTGQTPMEQINLILGKNYVISIRDGDDDIFEPVRKRIRKSAGNIRFMGADFLLYSIIDLVVDNYFVVLEEFGEKIESAENELIANPGQKTLDSINALKRTMMYMRKSLWPLREIINALDKGQTKLISSDIDIYLKDVYDHTIQVMDTVETYRDIMSSMLDIYLSSLSNKTNEIMKVLTIISTIFIPLTFIVGLYGMNFKYMPELEWQWGYTAVWGIMIVVVFGLIVYFKRKKWL